MNDAIAGLAGEIPQQRFACSLALARHLVLRGAERPYLPPGCRVGRREWPPTEHKAEPRLADAGVAHQHDLRVDIMDGLRHRSALPLRTQQVIEVEIVEGKARAGRCKARQRWMKRQTPKTVTRMPLYHSNDIPGFGTPDPDRVIPAHRRE